MRATQRVATSGPAVQLAPQLSQQVILPWYWHRFSASFLLASECRISGCRLSALALVIGALILTLVTWGMDRADSFRSIVCYLSAGVGAGYHSRYPVVVIVAFSVLAIPFMDIITDRIFASDAGICAKQNPLIQLSLRMIRRQSHSWRRLEQLRC